MVFFSEVILQFYMGFYIQSNSVEKIKEKNYDNYLINNKSKKKKKKGIKRTINIEYII